MKVAEGYVAFIEELPGANTQGATLDEARENLNEAVAVVLDANRALAEESFRRCRRNPRELRAPCRVKRTELIRHLERYCCAFLRVTGENA